MLNPKEIKEALNKHLESGELTRALEKHRIKNLAVFLLRENPYTALRRWAITDSQYERLIPGLRRPGIRRTQGLHEKLSLFRKRPHP